MEDFVSSQLNLALQVDIPLMKKLSGLTHEQLIELTRVSMIEYLGYLSENKAKEQIITSLEKWMSDQLEIIGKFELQADDITLINYVRAKTFRQIIPQYTTDIETTFELIDELDSFFTTSTTSATNTYIDILKERIAQNEKELLEAQSMAHIGSFDWNINTHDSNNSPELFRIFDMEKGMGFHHFLDYVHPEDKKLVETSLSSALKTGNYECEYRYVKNGRVKYIWSKGKVVYHNAKPTKLIGTVQDVTDMKKAEKELQEKTVALERSNESLQQFAYVASHDLKEPIRKISTFTDLVLIREQSLSESSRKNLEKVYQSSVRMRQMIDDIMAYSTLIQWEEKVQYPLEEVLKEAMEILEQSLEEKEAIIEYQNLPVACFVPAQFRQLFQNLISNSLKFSNKDVKPKISITYQWLTPEEVSDKSIIIAKKYLQLIITDNGIGFDQDAAEKIFALFSRLHAKTEYEGSGLGLAIAKRIIDNHNGLIHAKGVKGKGASFTIVIPQ